ncbi:Fe-S cluster assembly sulfur transfer protein SufU [Granulicoccus phenolivorans]|uniref:Fe-S cluster assembly sulfur transfer protein SufU n=1 Tax=Granulicoccus phenolivorans TaxID=266854 RepID=UPI0003FE7915|nr:SUF system NifU family Fe-S cluster assembly protein [Granulicoccus phenolivorans]
MDVEEMYQEIILDHYRQKHHSGLREPFDAQVVQVNPSCGDEVMLRVTLDGDTVKDVSYDGVGCSISQAATSVMTDLVIGKSVENARERYAEFHEMMHSKGRMEPNEETLEDGIAFVGVAKFVNRVKCALLGWEALREALDQTAAEPGGATATMTQEK